MDFNPDTWGTVADWVGGLGTTAAFVATAFVFFRDAKVRRIAQARKIVYIAEATEFYSIASTAFRDTGDGLPTPIHEYILKNLSDEPIYGVRFIASGGPRKGRRLTAREVVLPGDAFTYEDELDYPPVVAFRDNSDVSWVRNIKGKIHPTSAPWLTQKDAAYTNL
ncbi:hypothetical protein [Arthrobacter oryzae]|uniref:hypothetical protein n=1 Tax=Arthrobacter oryzae TaxID=409290 RepID=UPI00273CB4EB|nr:hypothetical protein [Arthrobacter oryzae]WLQ05677.1 hypothetical protein Q8Z05_16405 [Arthrobacter oryzae]